MNYRIFKNGRPFTFAQTHETPGGWVDPTVLAREDVFGMDITPVEEAWVLRSMDDLEVLGASHLTWTLGGLNKWRLERLEAR
jgi:hypothetical protein